jgi:transposase
VAGVEAVEGVVQIWVRSRTAGMACPDCAIVSEAVHSRYQRRLADLPIGGRPVSILYGEGDHRRDDRGNIWHACR